MNRIKAKRQKLAKRHARVRSRISGTAEKPRLSVRKSLKYVFLQLIDDERGLTIVSSSSKGLKAEKDNPYKGKSAVSYEAGKELGKKAVEKKIKKICFDRGGYAFQGRVKAVAEGARVAGLEF
ncbi:MAG: 50S ribosomal protein L18 [Candidatus Magasanikbacteria bacterium GW2011_GWC2_40_17]|uniref:Large ribosomal subunit protein uL18 n=1 Tax=Candidatus Magasanikbacteria bacterium GW2011_GWA2_42_32 TaxID=1619039 RepID=A0A0G1D446_9BACT|nr:MAG: 50S ribosomal protein L18 [Candidatus Magasanikbacteria bacterium GW2011_GWC2_40_17]KKS56788.1 MAG: 50S ribosomal protein L18 [Candidatus Magasanikbacteria bacterium GW2011_GWA2_42_32]OGH86026.1 MAG: 50S ribosomal protein L18 [Candidatus Magasanikbacteria bacterium RIFOXYB2_FULL_38_10]